MWIVIALATVAVVVVAAAAVYFVRLADKPFNPPIEPRNVRFPTPSAGDES